MNILPPPTRADRLRMLIPCHLRILLQLHLEKLAFCIGGLVALEPIFRINDVIQDPDAPHLVRFVQALALLLAALYLAGDGLRAIVRPYRLRFCIWLEDHPQSQANIRRGYLMPSKPALDVPYIVWGETHPAITPDGRGGIKFSPSVSADFSPCPEWVISAVGGLCTGNLILGATGSGKTSWFIRPAVFKLFHHATRPGGLVMDAKASLVEPLTAEMRAAGREADLLKIGPHQPTTWNPLHAPEASASALAERLLVVSENVRGSKYNSETRWIREGATQVAAGAIGMLRMTAGYVTSATLYHFLSMLSAHVQAAEAGEDTRRQPRQRASGSTPCSRPPRPGATKTTSTHGLCSSPVALTTTATVLSTFPRSRRFSYPCWPLRS